MDGCDLFPLLGKCDAVETQSLKLVLALSHDISGALLSIRRKREEEVVGHLF